MPAFTRQFSVSVGWRSHVVMNTSVTFVRRSAAFTASSDLRSTAMCFTPLGRSCLWRETPAIKAWRSISPGPPLPCPRSQRHDRAIPGGGFDGGFEDRDVVDEVFPG